MAQKIYIILLVAVICALSCFAQATDNRTFERFYHLPPERFNVQLDYYIQHNQIDSAILCAKIQASKYGKGNLTTMENKACCLAFRYIGLEYLLSYYDYQIAYENFLKAEEIAENYGFEPVGTHIAIEKPIFIATRDHLENNFVYNKSIMDGFKKAFYRTLNHIKNDSSVYGALMGLAASNLFYLALKYDKTKEVANVVLAYRKSLEHSETSVIIPEANILYNAIVFYNAGNYDKSLEILRTPLDRLSYSNDADFSQAQSVVKMSLYAVLLKSGKKAEALKLLLQNEQYLRDNEMTFELLETLQLIKQHYEMEGNEAFANKYALIYYTTKDEFINKSRLGKMDQAKLNLELEQTRERIREMSYRQKMQSLLLWSAVIIALLALTILGVLYANYHKTKRTNRLLYEKNIALLNDGKDLRPATSEIPEKTPHEEPTQADMELMEKITALMESSPEVFTEAFSLNRLAELVGSNSKYVSRAINSCKRCNFSVLLNEYRIKEACRRLMDTGNYGNYTIEGIANSVGYKSRSNFTTIFKDSVGLTPSAFQKLSRDGEGNIEKKE